MDSELVILLTAILLTLTSLVLLLTYDWRTSLVLLAIQYIGVFLMVMNAWPMAMSVTKLISGWIASAVLGMSVSGNPEIRSMLNINENFPTNENENNPSHKDRFGFGLAFRVFSAVLIGLTIASRLEPITEWLLGINPFYTWGALILIGLGLLKIGLTTQPFHVMVALLTALAGFEIIYAALDLSLVGAGLLAGINLALALVGAYLMVSPTMESAE